MRIPVSTYRLQLNSGFTFNNVADVISYLHELGITTIYASPFFAAAAGSMHGYDVCDPYVLNDEIGTIDQLERINSELKLHDMTWLQDVVPNHMAFSMRNQRLADVMERGSYSPYYNWFDVDWQHPDPMLNGKLMTPFLGKPLNECLNDHEITIGIGETGFVVQYGEQQFPFSVSAYEALSALLPHEVGKLVTQLQKEAMQGWPMPSWRQIKTSFIQSFMSNAQLATEVHQLLTVINNDPCLLQKLLLQQHYRLCFWKDANSIINYRRFFAVNELISVNIANEEVFYEYHQLLHNLYRQKLVHGLRIDHIDGLEAPGEYINRLRRFFGDDCYIIVEKILEQHEHLPPQWAVQGTTGYEFTAQINWLLTNVQGARELKTFYQSLFPHTPDYKTITFEKKRRFLEAYMGGEWNNLVRSLYTLQLVPDTVKPIEMKQALALFMCCLPVYRLYPGEQPPGGDAQQMIDETFEEAMDREPACQEFLQILKTIWAVEGKATRQPGNEATRQPGSEATGQPGNEAASASINLRRLEFQKRLMQFTGPLTAKGVEDTTFYVYNALLGHNEVGDTPNKEAYSIGDFHRFLQQRQQQYPFAMNTTSTHDTKRGEDGRLRVNVLTWLVDEWKRAVEDWRSINTACKENREGQIMPTLEDEYFIYQSLIAGFPANEQVTADDVERLKAYFIKSAREAKLFTNWQQPDALYEEAGCRFIEKMLSPRHDFLKSFHPFFRKVLAQAQILSLSQALVKITAPGVPDVYQGSEGWNTSYVDPDNRRPVDYSIFKKYVMEIKELEQKGSAAVLSYVSSKRTEGLEKFYVTCKALQCRRESAAVFLHGTYIPLYTSNDCGIIAYARQYQKEWVLVIAPVSVPFGECFLTLPTGAPVTWKNRFTGETIQAAGRLSIHTILNNFPVALLTGTA